MNFKEAIYSGRPMLTEGAIVERLKSEFNVKLDKYVNHAGLIYDPAFYDIIKGIYQEYIDVAASYSLPIMLMTPTRRANRDRIQQSACREKNLNYDCAVFLKNLQNSNNKLPDHEVYIGGLMGCKGDAYSTNEVLSAEDAYKFHSWQANELGNAGIDYLFAGIMPALTEAIGMAKAMSNTYIPYIISFMVRDNGRLLDGTSINDAIARIDAAVKFQPVCYMANCVHPTVLNKALSVAFNRTQLVKDRFGGLQANTSALRPEDLNNSSELKAEEPEVFAKYMEELNRSHQLKIYGGCCGTNKLHIEKIASDICNLYL